MSSRRKTVARGTWRTSADMLWLQELLCNIGLRPWVEALRKQGTSIRLRRSVLPDARPRTFGARDFSPAKFVNRQYQ